MLVLSRNVGHSVIIDGNIRVAVIGIRGREVRVAIDAPKDVAIRRDELAPRGAGPRPGVQGRGEPPSRTDGRPGTTRRRPAPALPAARWGRRR